MFYDLPAEHWKHLRTSDHIESVSQPFDCGIEEPRAAARESAASLWSTN